MAEAIMFSEKVAVTLAVGATPVALAVGEVLTTEGGPGPGSGGGGGGGVVSSSAARHPSALQPRRRSSLPSRRSKVAWGPLHSRPGCGARMDRYLDHRI